MKLATKRNCKLLKLLHHASNKTLVISVKFDCLSFLNLKEMTRMTLFRIFDHFVQSSLVF